MPEREHPTLSVEVSLDIPFDVAKRELIETFERAYLTHNLRRTSMNLSATSRITGISRKHIRTLVRRYELPKDLGREEAQAEARTEVEPEDTSPELTTRDVTPQVTPVAAAPAHHTSYALPPLLCGTDG